MAFKIGNKLEKKNHQFLAEIQANFYSEKIVKLKNNLPKVNFDPLLQLKRAFSRWRPDERFDIFKIKKVTEGDVLEMLKNMKNGHAYGNDLIDSATLKIGAKFLAKPLQFVINSSLETSTFPMKWKLGRILPLQKSREANPLDPKSFCPVTQLSTISKLAERVVQSQLLKYLELTGQLSNDQHAYRSSLRTSTAMINLMDTIATAVDENKIASTMSIDLSAAFDSVEHPILLKKLEYYNIDSSTMKWLKSYLKDRSSYVEVGTARSTIKSQRCGVPQGSVLGPLLYLIYVNEFASIIEDDLCNNQSHDNGTSLFGGKCSKCGEMSIYADDAQFVVYSASRFENQISIENCFQRIVDFLSANGLEINQGKTTLTEFMCKQKRARLPGIPPDLTVQQYVAGKLQDKHITDIPVCRILGTNLQNNLGWEAHLVMGKYAVLPKIRSQIGMLCKLKDSLSQKARLHLVNSLIISKFSYMISLWGNTTQNQVRKAQIVMNIAARYVTGLERITRQTELMKACDLLDIAGLTSYHSLLTLWKTVRWNRPLKLRERLSLEEEDVIRTDIPRLQLTELAFRCRTVSIWNTLPIHLRTETRIKTFKRDLKLWLKNRGAEDLQPD